MNPRRVNESRKPTTPTTDKRWPRIPKGEHRRLGWLFAGRVQR